MFIEPNKPVTVDELIHGMVIQSGNDACIALAEAIAGSEEVFAQMMNQQAQKARHEEHELRELHRSAGPKHYTTAYDMALLAAALIRSFPEHYKLNAQRSSATTTSRRPIAIACSGPTPTSTASRPGTTRSAGYCLVASAKRDSRRLISVVTGTAFRGRARSREPEDSQLWFPVLRYGHGLREGDQTVATLRVWKGADDDVRSVSDRDLFWRCPRATPRSSRPRWRRGSRWSRRCRSGRR